MTDEARITVAGLCIVAKDGEPVPKAPAKHGRKPRMAKIHGKFAPVEPQRLYDRRFDIVYPPRTRLYLFIMAESKRGMEPFRLTSAMAAKLGIGRQLRLHHLKCLERKGLIHVRREGRQAILVSATGRIGSISDNPI